MATEDHISKDIIAQLNLAPHLEGGFYSRTFTSAHTVKDRAAMSAIYYLLSKESSVGHLHKNHSDILHFWQHGSAIDYTLLAPDGSVTNIVMGPDLAAGQQLQMLVPGGYWKASELRQGEYGLISEAVCPGFDFNDHKLADASQIQRDYPQHWATLKHLIAS
ncbi:cupin domain-containing protein [uncultured Zhongshania sp.]|uniref:cupin domain-containing protein n=1 Tax=uncultured Zhongshania sp. TaxID=1642288 RepID=UPI0030DCF823|tara:strand:- start:1003 stop:1488 length:486 start_codon:yes stop_codon:yes gene_type:complete